MLAFVVDTLTLFLTLFLTSGGSKAFGNNCYKTVEVLMLTG